MKNFLKSILTKEKDYKILKDNFILEEITENAPGKLWIVNECSNVIKILESLDCIPNDLVIEFISDWNKIKYTRKEPVILVLPFTVDYCTTTTRGKGFIKFLDFQIIIPGNTNVYENSLDNFKYNKEALDLGIVNDQKLINLIKSAPYLNWQKFIIKYLL